MFWILLVDLWDTLNKVCRCWKRANLRKLWLIVKDSLLDKRGIELFIGYAFGKDVFASAYAVKRLAGNKLKGNKSILIGNIIHRVTV